MADQALDEGIIDAGEAELLKDAGAARDDAIQVDSFTLEEYRRRAVLAGPAEPPAEKPAGPVPV